MQTLTDIMAEATQITPEQHRAQVAASRRVAELRQSLLPIERDQIKDVEVAEFVEGYDDQFPRVNFAKIARATRKIKGQDVPAFAIYNIDSDRPDQRVHEISVDRNRVVSETYKSTSDRKVVSQNIPQVSGQAERLQSALLHMGSENYIPLACAAMLATAVATIMIASFASSMVFMIFALIAGPLAFMQLMDFKSISLLAGSENMRITTTITHSFKGVIPAHIKSEILIPEVTSRFRRIFLIEEAYNWKCECQGESTARDIVRNLDPLLIGETKEGAYFLLAKFDVTPLEEQALRGALLEGPKEA